jgi:hypothetical protein
MSDQTRPEHIDPLFAEPYVDVDEWRDIPVRHRRLQNLARVRVVVSDPPPG